MEYKKEIDKHIDKINKHFEIVNETINQINEKDLYYFEIRQQMICYKNNKRFEYGYEPTKNQVICLSRALKETKAEAMKLRKRLDDQQSKARTAKRKHEKIIDEIKAREIAKIKIDQ